MLRWIISAVGFATLKGEVSAAIQRTAQRVILAFIVLILWFAAFGFAIAALVVWLTEEVGGLAACGIIAAGFAVIAIVIQVIMAIAARRQPKSTIKMSIPGFSTNADGTQSPDVGSLGSMAIVGVAGYLLGRLLFRK